jgi:general stress protein YciG
MAGTKAGGLKARETNLKLHGIDFYKRIGRMGGKAGDPTKKGFASNIERAKKAGAKGGKISKRGPAKKHQAEADGNAGTN